MRRTFRLTITALGAAYALTMQAAPAQAWGTGVDACGLPGMEYNSGTSTAHEAWIYACIGDDDSYLYATAAIVNRGTIATYKVTAQLRRGSDNLLIATQGCTVIVDANEDFYCTKAWPWSSTPVYTTAVVTRSPLQTQAIVSSVLYFP
ncbi:MAG TPA: hypothetical protein VGX28_07590 [Frankiaceae bacterium]|jgi:hypothetical protein|nr:hypothetical protein [Frankiaceae bacterium]